MLLNVKKISILILCLQSCNTTKSAFYNPQPLQKLCYERISQANIETLNALMKSLPENYKIDFFAALIKECSIENAQLIPKLKRLHVALTIDKSLQDAYCKERLKDLSLLLPGSLHHTQLEDIFSHKQQLSDDDKRYIALKRDDYFFMDINPIIKGNSGNKKSYKEKFLVLAQNTISFEKSVDNVAINEALKSSNNIFIKTFLSVPSLHKKIRASCRLNPFYINSNCFDALYQSGCLPQDYNTPLPVALLRYLKEKEIVDENNKDYILSVYYAVLARDATALKALLAIMPLGKTLKEESIDKACRHIKEVQKITYWKAKKINLEEIANMYAPIKLLIQYGASLQPETKMALSQTIKACCSKKVKKPSGKNYMQEFNYALQMYQSILEIQEKLANNDRELTLIPIEKMILSPKQKPHFSQHGIDYNANTIRVFSLFSNPRYIEKILPLLKAFSPVMCANKLRNSNNSIIMDDGYSFNTQDGHKKKYSPYDGMIDLTEIEGSIEQEALHSRALEQILIKKF